VHLEQFGWSPFFAEAFKELTPGLSAGRVAMANRGICRLWTGNGKVVARAGGAQQVVAGDWVAYDPASSVIRAVLPRRTKLSRKQAGRVTAEQVLPPTSIFCSQSRRSMETSIHDDSSAIC